MEVYEEDERASKFAHNLSSCPIYSCLTNNMSLGDGEDSGFSPIVLSDLRLLTLNHQTIRDNPYLKALYLSHPSCQL